MALYAVEAYGIFKIGEMIGRRHVVGYKLGKFTSGRLSRAERDRRDGGAV